MIRIILEVISITFNLLLIWSNLSLGFKNNLLRERAEFYRNLLKEQDAIKH